MRHADGPGNSDFEEPFWFELFDLDKGKRRRFSSLLHAESCRPQSSSSDPWQMDNIYDEMKKSDPTMVKALRDETHRWFECKGTEGAEACP